MSDLYGANESGMNPVDSDTGNKDIYFSNEDFAKKIREGKRDAVVTTAVTKQKRINTVASTYLFFVIVIIVSMIISVYAIFCLNDLFGITKTKSTVTVTYDEDIESISEAVDLLYDNDLITCKNFCKFFLNLETLLIKDSSVRPTYYAGSYYLNGKMGIENMLVVMKGTADTTETVSIVFYEGITTGQIVKLLVDNEVCEKAALLQVIESTSFKYSLVSELESKETVPYRLEGYLFPDTYTFYIGESASSVIDKFLDRGNSLITDEHRARAEELGFTMQEIITIASIIQSEAGSISQMKEIAAVIENRLKDTVNNPSLGCQSTSDYIKNKVSLYLTNTSHTADYYLQYYNTNSDSKVVGLPEGPICNPGLDAIEAALYPANNNNLYFFHDTKGNLYTASDYSEFKKLIQTYAPYLDY